MLIENIIPTHNSLRDYKKVEKFIKRIRKGRIFRGMRKPITLTRTEDAKIYLHDGHHRVYAAWKCGLKELLDGEYILRDMVYKKYMEINIGAGWVTPYDLKYYCRKSEFFEFKNEVFKYYNTLEHCKDDKIKDYIISNSKEYLEPRLIYKIGEIQCP